MTLGSREITSDKELVRINIELGGEPAQILNELKHRGLVQNNVDAVAQALIALHEKIIKRDLAKLRLGLQQEK
ncbi:MAG: hypothetical protein JRN52_06510 [Nitrososphaerota archaeon]|nr:hypothetical protein [Nitrososphaerota archaeon]